MKNYKVIDLAQGSKEWLELRYNYLTASQAAVLFDLSPYQTPLGLFEEKVLRQETQNTKGKEVLFARGHAAEAAGRIYLQEKKGLDLKPAVLVSTQHPSLMASLDGFCEKTNVIFESKLVGAEALKNAREGNYVPHHICQIQASLLVSGARKCLYFLSDTSGDSHLVEILPDLVYQEQIAIAAKTFMENVAKGEAPEPGEKDFFEVQDDALFTQYLNLDSELKALEEKMAEVRKTVVEKYGNHRRVRCGAVTVCKSIRQGNVDYKKIPMLKGIDLDKFRKPSTEVTTIRIEKPKAKKAAA
jgi:putative phage-type endonuclease